jgi:hypothetical protein
VERDWRQGHLFLIDIAGMTGIETLERLGIFDVSLTPRATHAEALTGAEVAGAMNPETSADCRVRVARDVARSCLSRRDSCTVGSGLTMAATAVAATIRHGNVDKRRHVGNLDASAS